MPALSRRLGPLAVTACAALALPAAGCGAKKSNAVTVTGKVVYKGTGEAAARAKCSNNLKQLALAMHNYHDARGELPPDRIVPDWPTWAVLILPFIEQDNAYRLWDVTKRF